jgi:hypothetical protein
MLCSSGPAYATGVAVDRAGNVAVGGAFAGTVDFGPGGPGPISSVGGSASSDGFVARYNAQGGLLWVKRLGAAASDYVQTIVVDSQDNIIVAGRFNGTVDFGGVSLTSVSSSGLYTDDIFVAKYLATGTLSWVSHFGGTGSDIVEQGNTLAIDGSGNVVLAAKFQDGGLWGRQSGSAGNSDVTGQAFGSDGCDDVGMDLAAEY